MELKKGIWFNTIKEAEEKITSICNDEFIMIRRCNSRSVTSYNNGNLFSFQNLYFLSSQKRRVKIPRRDRVLLSHIYICTLRKTHFIGLLQLGAK